jgi:hypothetical protein
VQERLKVVNEQMTPRRIAGMNRAKKREYIFSGLLSCGVCAHASPSALAMRRRGPLRTVVLRRLDVVSQHQDKSVTDIHCESGEHPAHLGT